MKQEAARNTSPFTPAKKDVRMRAVFVLFSVLWHKDVAAPVGDGLISCYGHDQIDKTKSFHPYISQNTYSKKKE